MKVGDLVRLYVLHDVHIGIVTGIISSTMVLVIWNGTDYEYIEPIKYLEVLS